MNTKLPEDQQFNKYYLSHCKHLRLNGLRPKTIEAYSRAIRRIGNYFNCRIDNLTSDDLLDDLYLRRIVSAGTLYHQDELFLQLFQLRDLHYEARSKLA